MQKVASDTPPRPETVATDAMVLENLDGLVEHAREHLIRAAGLFAVLQGAPEGHRPDVADAFNAAAGEVDHALEALRSSLEKLLDGTHAANIRSGTEADDNGPCSEAAEE